MGPETGATPIIFGLSFSVKGARDTGKALSDFTRGAPKSCAVNLA